MRTEPLFVPTKIWTHSELCILEMSLHATQEKLSVYIAKLPIDSAMLQLILRIGFQCFAEFLIWCDVLMT